MSKPSNVSNLLKQHTFSVASNDVVLGSWTLDQGRDANGEPTFDLKLDEPARARPGSTGTATRAAALAAAAASNPPAPKHYKLNAVELDEDTTAVKVEVVNGKSSSDLIH